MKYFFVTSTMFLLLNTLTGCRHSGITYLSSDWKSEISKSPEINHQIDLLKAEIKQLYSTNPDSAITYYLKASELYKKYQMHYNTFDAYLKISELYCFRLNDGINAVYYYGEALKIMNRYGGVEDYNPFFYIDMGNMFYMHQLFTQAHQSYDKAIKISAQKNDNFALSVAQNCKGIVYREESNYEEAKKYFKKSLVIRSKITSLYKAQNYLYLAKLFNYQHIADSIIHYRDLAEMALNEHQKQSVDSAIITPTAAKALADAFYIYIDELTAVIFTLKNEPNMAINNYQKAYTRAILAEDNATAMIYLYEIASLYNKLQRQNDAKRYAIQAHQYASKYQNFEYIVNASKLLNLIYSENNNVSQANYYLNQIISFTDSLNRSKTSEKLQSAKILLITNQVEDSVRYYQIQVKKHRKVQKAQSLSIVLLSVSLIGVITLLIFVLRKRLKIKQEHLKQMASFLKKLELEEQKKTNEMKHISTKFEDKLAYIMVNEKVYLQKNITLASLADMLETNVTYLSQHINNQLKTNFNDYINSQRINEACRLFRDNSSLKFSVEQIADMVGFSSRTTFYTTFKKFTGITPAFFQKYILTPEVQYYEETKPGTNE